MTDLAAMALFVAAGNKAVQWHCVDEAERMAYRKMALEMVPTHGFEPQYPEPNSGVLPLDEAGEIGTGPRI